MMTTFTHATLYDASDNHGIVLEGERITGCSCGFRCEEWDIEGDALVNHLRALGPRFVQRFELDDPEADDGSPLTFTIAAGDISQADE